jgi:hypothetical protein
MAHPLIDQLRFTRAEFMRGLEGVSEEEGFKRFLPINSIGWIVGHLAQQEQRYWLYRAQGKALAVPELKAQGYGEPATTPPLREMLQAWEKVVAAVDPWLDTLTTADMNSYMIVEGKPFDESTGSMVRRVTYHYWFHNGEAQAIRQLLGHTHLPTFVGDIQQGGPYRPE